MFCILHDLFATVGLSLFIREFPASFQLSVNTISVVTKAFQGCTKARVSTISGAWAAVGFWRGQVWPSSEKCDGRFLHVAYSHDVTRHWSHYYINQKCCWFEHFWSVLKHHGHLSATTFAVRRLLHSKPGDVPFGIYKTVKDADGNFQSTLRLTNRAPFR